MNRYKIVHVTSSLKIGGAEKVLFNLIRNLDHTKYEHIVMYIHGGPYVNKLEQHGIKTIQVRGLFFKYDPWLLVRLYRSIKSIQPNCIHSLLWLANLFARIAAYLCSIPCICVLHNNLDQNGFFRNLLDKFTTRIATINIAVSEQVAQSAIEYNWVPAKKLEVIHNGIALPQKKNVIIRASLGLLENHFIIGAVGRFAPIKRFDLLIELFAQLLQKHEHIRLLLIGIGEDELRLKALVQKFGISNCVIFIVGQSALNYYHLFDCFVQTSAKEGISLALLEAMSFKLPCLVMNAGLRHSVIETNNTGLIVDADDHESFKEALTKLIYNEQQRNKLGLHAFDKIKQIYSLNKMIKKYDLLFERIAKK